MNAHSGLSQLRQQKSQLIKIINKISSKLISDLSSDHIVFATTFCEGRELIFLEFDSDRILKNNYIKDSIVGHSLVELKPMIIKNLTELPLYQPSIDNPFRYNTRSLLIVPCYLDKTEDCFGTLLLYKDTDSFTEVELETADSIVKKFISKNFNKVESATLPFIKCLHDILLSDLSSELKPNQLREFFSSVIHDIRTPMNAVIGFLELIKEDATDTDREYANAALKSAEMVIALVNDVLDFNKIVSGNLDIDLHYFSLPEELESSSRVFYHTARKKKIDLVSYFDPEIPYVIKSDPFRVKQIINNLLSNAIKFTDVEGEVYLEAFYDNKDDTLVIMVKDNGIGIEPESLERIFEPFKQANSTTSSKYGGTGLGLSISKKLSNMLGGDLSVESKVGKGSTFKLTLPCNTIPGTPKYLEYTPYDFPMVYLVEGDISKHRYIMYYSKYFEKLSIPFEIVPYKDIFNKVFEPDSILIAVKFNYESEVTQEFIDSYLDQLIMIQHSMFIRLKEKHKDLTVLEAPIFPEKLFDTLLNFKKKNAPAKQEKLTSNKTILVVDDNAINRKLMEEIATRLGSKVYSASDGQEAIEIFSQHPVDLIFIDQNMPILSGTEAIKKIRSMPGTDKVSIYGLTGTTDDNTVKTMIDAGANAILSKPVQINKLKEIILKQ